MTGAEGGVQEPWAWVRTSHCVAQAGRFDAKRVTCWAEMMEARKERMEGMRKGRMVSGFDQYKGTSRCTMELMVTTRVKAMVMKVTWRREE